MNKYIQLLRVKHYIKNFLICIPSFFALGIFNMATLKRLALGFICFSLASSFVYIINDVKDVEKDRLHEYKRFRPIASGEISAQRAIRIAFILLVGAGLCNYFLNSGFFTEAAFYLSAYILLNLLYSFGLKDIPILDVFILASGFVLRILYGASVSGVTCSNWLILTVITVSLYLGLGKRRNELVKNKNAVSRKVLKVYSINFLDIELHMCVTLSLVFYSLWTTEFGDNKSGGKLLWTIPIVLAIVMRYNLELDREGSGDPVEVVYKDRILLVLILGYMVIMFAILYGSIF